MHGLDFFRACEIGDGVGDYEGAAVGTGGEIQLLHGHAEHVEALGIGLGKLVEHALGHLCIAVRPSPPTLPEGEF